MRVCEGVHLSGMRSERTLPGARRTGCGRTTRAASGAHRLVARARVRKRNRHCPHHRPRRAALAATLAGSGGRGARLKEVEPVCAGQPVARQEAGPRAIGAGGWPLTEHGQPHRATVLRYLEITQLTDNTTTPARITQLPVAKRRPHPRPSRRQRADAQHQGAHERTLLLKALIKPGTGSVLLQILGPQAGPWSSSYTPPRCAASRQCD